MFELTGTIKEIYDTQTFGNEFTKREFIVTESKGKYPQYIKFEALKDNAAKLDDYAPGDSVSVAFGIRGNEWKEKYYVNLVAWNITPLEKYENKSQPEPEPDPEPEPELATAEIQGDATDEDVLF